MTDFYAEINKVDTSIQEKLAEVLEMRASDSGQKEMLESYLNEIEFPENSHVIEIGSGTGGVSRTIAKWPNVGRVLGVDPSELFVNKAMTLGKGISNLSFETGDGRALQSESELFDVAVVHTTMCHVPNPEQLLGEAFRILKPKGWLAVFDGDYATATVAIEDNDPLEICIKEFRNNFCHDQWLVRRLPSLVASSGFDVVRTRSHGYIESGKAGYMLSWIQRGADVLKQSGRIGEETAQCFIDEATRRSDNDQWFGHIAFASLLARKSL